jgi:hypothetical protein
MKKLFLALLSLMAMSAFAQIEVTSTGNVGIGTTSDAEEKLVTRGNIRIRNANGSNPTLAGSLEFIESGLTWATDAFGFRILHDGSSNALLFQSSALTNLIDLLAIKRDGNIGIGTTDPQTKMNLASGIFQVGLNDPNDETDYWTQLHNNRLVFNRPDKSYIDFGNNSNSLIFRQGTPPVEVMNMLPSGNIGMGTPDPKEKLHIEGDFLINAFGAGNESGIFFRENFTDSNKYNMSILAYDHNGASSDGLSINGYDGISFSTGANTRNEQMRIDQNGNVGIGTTAPSVMLEINNPIVQESFNVTTGLDGRSLALRGETVDFKRAGRNYIAASNAVGTLAFSTGGSDIYNNNIRMSIDENGDVGIGTIDTYGYKLAVNGDLGVDGDIDVSATSTDGLGFNWPDYVFESDYKLLSLVEVEEHINEKGHLPNVPSAKEVKEKGSFSLGEMNKKLLEKVEELTLYLIDQNKKLAQQEQRIKALENELKTRNK